ncbi:response regulator transcription factor [Undibacterium sp. LX40W]|uniref:Response regulator transcription factor n=1 Tax=Undibacterium nitidum TaxID=2762298 RepID=A0A923HRL1_9BURK|nr:MULTISPECIES: LytTR family DNA-binding domain-containing protein [Undibacterium]MBC3882683.1 response regulator transcription factor [Undibacterium nitidum]MBC3892964.1 response regulator transcription factor [Undibacterium sp. LX40W]
MNIASNTIRAIIVDDEESGRITLSYALRKHSQWQVQAEFGNAGSARDYLLQHPVDVVFLDIQMPKENGISLARSISAMEHPPLVIFVTAYNAHAVDAFEVHALDYLLKPFNPRRFNEALERASEMLAQRNGYRAALSQFVETQHRPMPAPDYLEQVIVRSVGEMECVKLTDVLWVSSASNYVELHLPHRVVLHRMTLSEMEKRLNPEEFMRVHRTAIVRTKQMQQVRVAGDGVYQLALFGGGEVPVSERYIDAVRSHFQT